MPSTNDYTENLPYPNFETREQACYRRRYLVGNIRRNKSGAYQRLANKLERCDDDHPCGSGPCPLCMRGVRLRWVDDGLRYIKKEWCVKDVSFFMMVVPHHFVEPGKLLTMDPRQLKALTADHMERTGLHDLHAIGGINPTIWAYCGGHKWGGVIHAIGHHPHGIHWPLETTIIQEPIAPEELPITLGRLLESSCGLQIPSDDGSDMQQLVEPDWTTRELALWLDRNPVEDRMFLKGIRRDGDGLHTILEANKA